MYTFQFRRGTQSEWLASNPILSEGEPGVETDTDRFKVGDGVSTWTELKYYITGEFVSISLFTSHVNSELPHPIYDDGESFTLLYENAKV